VAAQLFSQPLRPIVHVCGVLITLVIGFLEYLTGYEVSFLGFYVISVGLAAWFGGRTAGLWAALFAAAVWLTVDTMVGHEYSGWWIGLWNAGMRLFTFLVIALGLSWIQQELTRERQHVHELKGLLPICSYCKKIRNDQGYWERIENYIKSRSEADFTHGVCPECFIKVTSQAPKSPEPTQ
jgi:hypothetical protein